MSVYNGTAKPAKKIWCSTTNCEQLVMGACTFVLGGKKQGQLCNRALCASCDQRGLCPSHRRLQDKREAP